MRTTTLRALLIGLAVTLAVPLAASSVAPAYAQAEGCASGVASDFNGDGRSDTAVADPYAAVNGQAQAGQVVVLYGDADNRVGEGARGVIHQQMAGIAGLAESGDRFGSAVAVADIDCDGYTDLVVGTPYEDLGSVVDSGYVQVVWGGPGGLGARPSRNLSQAEFALPVTAGDQFGYAVDALEDVGQGGTPNPDAYAIAIGVPGAAVSGHSGAGWVGFLVANDGGNVSFSVSQDSPGVPGGAETGDRFGASVSLNHLVGSANLIDAVVGSPHEDVGSKTDAGSITVLGDLYADTGPEGAVAYTQDSAGVPGGAEAGDLFGRSLDTIRSSGLGRVAVGVPGEDIGSKANAGSVQFFTGSGDVLNPGAALTQDTPGVSGVTESGDLFGDQVAWIGPGSGDSTTRLAVSAPREDLGSIANAGLVQVFPINSLGSETSYHQNTAGIPGVAEDGDQFGRSLSFVEGAFERVLLVGVPDDAANTNGMVNVIPIGAGAPRFWKPGSGGVPAAGASRFGAALASVTD